MILMQQSENREVCMLNNYLHYHLNKLHKVNCMLHIVQKMALQVADMQYNMYLGLNNSNKVEYTQNILYYLKRTQSHRSNTHWHCKLSNYLNNLHILAQRHRNQDYKKYKKQIRRRRLKEEIINYLDLLSGYISD